MKKNRKKNGTTGFRVKRSNTYLEALLGLFRAFMVCYTTEESGCSWVLAESPKGRTIRNQLDKGDSKLKFPDPMYPSFRLPRIKCSLIHFAVWGMPMKPVDMYTNEEKFVREWLSHSKLKFENIILEVNVCVPEFPMISGVLDGLVNINGKYCIVEFKTCLLDSDIEKKSNFFECGHVFIQILTYSYLTGWSDAYLVYQEYKDGVLYTKTKFFNFSKTKPFLLIFKKFYEKKILKDHLDIKSIAAIRKFGLKNNIKPKFMIKDGKKQNIEVFKKTLIKRMGTFLKRHKEKIKNAKKKITGSQKLIKFPEIAPITEFPVLNFTMTTKRSFKEINYEINKLRKINK